MTALVRRSPALFKLPSWVIDLSPFQHVPAIPAQDLSAQPLIVLTAVATGLSERTVKREWRFARAWMIRELQ